MFSFIPIWILVEKILESSNGFFLLLRLVGICCIGVDLEDVESGLEVGESSEYGPISRRRSIDSQE